MFVQNIINLVFVFDNIIHFGIDWKYIVIILIINDIDMDGIHKDIYCFSNSDMRVLPTSTQFLTTTTLQRKMLTFTTMHNVCTIEPRICTHCKHLANTAFRLILQQSD